MTAVKNITKNLEKRGTYDSSSAMLYYLKRITFNKELESKQIKSKVLAQAQAEKEVSSNCPWTLHLLDKGSKSCITSMFKILKQTIPKERKHGDSDSTDRGF